MGEGKRRAPFGGWGIWTRPSTISDRITSACTSHSQPCARRSQPRRCTARASSRAIPPLRLLSRRHAGALPTYGRGLPTVGLSWVAPHKALYEATDVDVTFDLDTFRTIDQACQRHHLGGGVSTVNLCTGSLSRLTHDRAATSTPNGDSKGETEVRVRPSFFPVCEREHEASLACMWALKPRFGGATPKVRTQKP